ncbi:MAG: glycoside hydrolase family 26 protein [Bacteroidales bacterium]|nr:glycoside hydrolase family 26 protein [Bacteroidales bacterium]
MRIFRYNLINLLVVFLLIAGAAFGKNPVDKSTVPVDCKATPETRALFRNLKKIQDKQTLVGHHDATLYGHGWMGEDNRSDIKDVTGSHPALIGFDFALVTNKPSEMTRNRAGLLQRRIIETYNRGGVVAMCWHSDNPLNGGTAWVDTTKTVENTIKELLPGGMAHEKFKTSLRQISDFAKTCVGNDGKLVPMIFRPFHEMEGEWFWWGRPYRTQDEFVKVWRFTVEYLRDTLETHNLLYAYSPDCRFYTPEEFLTDYPGDDYADVLGMDNYWDFRPDGANDIKAAAGKMKIVSDLAQKKGKIAAMTETGLESIPDDKWFTQKLDYVLRSKKAKIAFVMLWRNDNRMKNHFYAPFPGHSSAPDFIEYYKMKHTLFENNLKNIYK